MQLKDAQLFRQQAYIDGAWVDADGGQTIKVNNPATGDILGTVPKMGAAETRRAIEAADKALADFEARFKQGAMPDEIPEVIVPSVDGGVQISSVLKQAGLTASTSEAIRLIDQGGVKLDGEKVTDKSLRLDVGVVAVIQVGKRKFARVTIA